MSLQLGLQVPSNNVGVRVGGSRREWESGKVLVFDDSFETEVWNDNDAGGGDLYFLQLHTWHPALAPLVEESESTKWNAGIEPAYGARSWMH
jgi:hypothetical protein